MGASTGNQGNRSEVRAFPCPVPSWLSWYRLILSIDRWSRLLLCSPWFQKPHLSQVSSNTEKVNSSPVLTFLCSSLIVPGYLVISLLPSNISHTFQYYIKCFLNKPNQTAICFLPGSLNRCTLTDLVPTLSSGPWHPPFLTTVTILTQEFFVSHGCTTLPPSTPLSLSCLPFPSCNTQVLPWVDFYPALCIQCLRLYYYLYEEFIFFFYLLWCQWQKILTCMT